MYELIIQKEMIDGDNFQIDGKNFIYREEKNDSPLTIEITNDIQELLQRSFDCMVNNGVNCFLEKTTNWKIRVYMKPTFYSCFTYAWNELWKTTNNS